MDRLPLDLWRFVLAWCTPRELLELRTLNKTTRALIAQLAFPRKIRKDIARRWFCEPAFQARVAATMARPERDLHVLVSVEQPIPFYDDAHVHDVSAVSVLRIIMCESSVALQMPHRQMPRIAVCGPIARLLLLFCTFAHDRCINAELCTTIALGSWTAREHYEFPRQLSAWYIISSLKEDAYAVAAKYAFRENLIHWPFLTLTGEWELPNYSL